MKTFFSTIWDILRSPADGFMVVGAFFVLAFVVLAMGMAGVLGYYALDRLFLPEFKTTGIVAAKEYREAHTDRRLRSTGKALYTSRRHYSESWVVRFDTPNGEGCACVTKAFYDDADKGETFVLWAKISRFSGRVLVTTIKEQIQKP